MTDPFPPGRLGFGAKGVEDVAFHPLKQPPAGLQTWAGGGAIDSMMSAVVPVLVLNQNTGEITEKPLTESVYWSSISSVGSVVNYFPIWDFEPEAPDPTAESVFLKIASGIIDIVAAKLAPPVALLARALDRSAAIAQGGVSTLAVIRGIWVKMGGVRFQITNGDQRRGVQNAGGARPGWPIFGSSSFGYGIQGGAIASNAKLSLGTNQTAGVYPFFDAFDGFARTYEGMFSGQFVTAAEDQNFSQWLNTNIMPIAMTPGEVLHIHPALDPGGGSGIPAWPSPGSVAICWSEFRV